jgi:hypothetical protein
MPLFDWNVESMQSVTTDHFWMYWAVTLPLTVVVMGVVVLYAVHQYQQRKKELEDAQKGVVMMIV